MRNLPVVTIFAVTILIILFSGCSPEEPAKVPEPAPAQTAAAEQENSVEIPKIEGTQALCPVMGNPVSHRLYSDYKGKRIYFCCPPCIKTFENDPDKYIKKMAEEGIELAPVPEEN